MNPARRLPYTLLVAGILLVAAFVLARRPYYNWDMFPYMAIVMSSPEVPFETTHQAVYLVAQSHMPAYDFEAIASRQPELRRDAKAFEEILRYHTIKPGYTGIARLLYRLGVHPLAATWLPSIASYFLLGLLLFVWSSRYAPVPAAALFMFVILLSPLLVDLARYSSPDLLCTLICTAGLTLVLLDQSVSGIALLSLAILVRPDAALLVVPVAGALAIGKKLPYLIAGAWILAACLVAGYLLREVAGEYLLANTSWGERLAHYKDGLLLSGQGYWWPMTLFALITLAVRRTSDVLSWLLIAAVASIVARFLLHPFVEDRFFVPAYLLILLVMWQSVCPRVFRAGASES